MFLAQNGQPIWDAAIKFKKSETDFVLIIPTKTISDTETTTFFIAKYINNTFRYEMHRKQNLYNGSVEQLSWNLNKEKVQQYFHYFDLNVLNLSKVKHIDCNNYLDNWVPKPSSTNIYSSNTLDNVILYAIKPRVKMPVIGDADISAAVEEAGCFEVEIWFNPDNDECHCNGDEYFTGETYWAGDCGSGGGGSTWIGDNGGNGGSNGTGNGSGWNGNGTGGGGGSNNGTPRSYTCLWYMACYVPPVEDPIVRDSTYFKNILRLRSEAISRASDSVFNLAQINHVEYSGIITKKNDVLKARNLKTDNLDYQSQIDYRVYNQEELVGAFHTHQNTPPYTNNPIVKDRCSADIGDVYALIGTSINFKQDFTTIAEIGDERQVLVIEDPVKAKLFLKSINKYTMLKVNNDTLVRNPKYYPDYRQATLEVLLWWVGNSNNSGIGYYKSIDINKNEFIKLN